MSEFLHNPDSGSAQGGAVGSAIRQARLNKGLSLETLAAVLKVTPAKLDALESGRFSELPDLAFARALAKTVCRYLELDSAAVLSAFPSIRPVDLSSSEHRGVPFKASKARLNLDVASSMPFKLEFKAQWLVPLGILLAALAVYFMPAPSPWLHSLGERWSAMGAAVPASEASGVEAGASAASSKAELPVALAQQNASAAEVASSEVQEPVLASAPMASGSEATASVLASSVPATTAASAALPLAANGDMAVQLLAAEPAWVEVKDASGAKVLSRHLLSGESAEVGGQAPFTLKIGNATAVKLNYRGQPVELAAFTRSNVARLELK
jgi:cytoskeleton protein RodZ